MRKAINYLIIFLCVVSGLFLAWAIFEMPSPSVHLPEQVLSNLEKSGVSHPVTAVLLNFRGYDTLLEVAVLFLALLCVLDQIETKKKQKVISENLFALSNLQILQWLARILVPLMILMAGYLLLAGAHQPGGAFQAGAVLAGAGVLLHLTHHLLPTQVATARILRMILISGLLIFLMVAVAGMAILSPPGLLLQYPPDWAGTLILLIEAGLTLSLGFILAGLFLTLEKDIPDKETKK